MLDKTVGHLVQREADVLQADLLADDIKRHCRETVVHGAHHARQHRAVADAGVEHAHRRRARMNIGELHADTMRDFPFLRAGVHEQQIFLPVVEEAEIALRVVARLSGSDRRRRRLDQRERGRRRVEQHAAARRHSVGVARHETADAFQSIGGDAPAIAQAVGELAVVHRAAAEGGFGQAALAAEFADLLQDLIVHDGASSRLALSGRLMAKGTKSARRRQLEKLSYERWAKWVGLAHYLKYMIFTPRLRNIGYRRNNWGNFPLYKP